MGLGPGARGCGSRSEAVPVALVAFDLSLRCLVWAWVCGAVGEWWGRRVGSRGLEMVGVEINGIDRGGGLAGDARAGVQITRDAPATPPIPHTKPSIRTHSHTADRHAPGSRWRRRRSPPLMFAGCCQTASARPHLRCRRRSAMRRCRARVWACGTRTCCSRGSSRAGRGFLGAAWLPWEVVLRAPSV